MIVLEQPPILGIKTVERSLLLCKGLTPLKHMAKSTMPTKGFNSVQTHSIKQNAEPPTAPGSASNFTGLPEDDNAIPVTTAVSSTQMQVSSLPVAVVNTLLSVSFAVIFSQSVLNQSIQACVNANFAGTH